MKFNVLKGFSGTISARKGVIIEIPEKNKAVIADIMNAGYIAPVPTAANELIKKQTSKKGE